MADADTAKATPRQEPNAGVGSLPRAPTPPKAELVRAHSTGELLRCRVNSDSEELQLLHEVYGWVPGEAHVRPTPSVRAQKELLLSNLGSMWSTNADWVFHNIFGSPTTRGNDGKRSAARPPEGSTLFAVNPFPYNVPPGTEHWVFWMASSEAEWPEARVNSGIAEAVDARGGGQFVWYPNPKMSIGDPRLHHVQVFWRPKKPLS